MPTLQFSDPVNKIAVTKQFMAPVKAADLWKGWYKTCRKLCSHIPEVPELVGHFNTIWLCDPPPEVDTRWIKFTIRNRVTDERVYLVIDRKGPSM
jgi:hypothetical protein